MSECQDIYFSRGRHVNAVVIVDEVEVARAHVLDVFNEGFETVEAHEVLVLLVEQESAIGRANGADDGLKLLVPSVRMLVEADAAAVVIVALILLHLLDGSVHAALLLDGLDLVLVLPQAEEHVDITDEVVFVVRRFLEPLV